MHVLRNVTFCRSQRQRFQNERAFWPNRCGMLNHVSLAQRWILSVAHPHQTHRYERLTIRACGSAGSLCLCCSFPLIYYLHGRPWHLISGSCDRWQLLDKLIPSFRWSIFVFCPHGLPKVSKPRASAIEQFQVND